MNETLCGPFDREHMILNEALACTLKPLGGYLLPKAERR